MDRRDFVAGVAAGAPMLARGKRQPRIDVVIVGAGLSGLVAATDLVAAGREVAVLEARDRVGGRVMNQRLEGGGFVEAGGQFVGAQHEAVLALAKSLDVPTFKTYLGPPRRGAEPRDHLAALSPEMLDLVGDLETRARQVDPAAPWSSPVAAAWDKLSVAAWLAERRASSAAASQVASILRRSLGAVPDELSLLWWLTTLRSGGGLRTLEAFEGGAREFQFVGGAFRLAGQLAQRLDSRVVLNSPVARIAVKAGGVEVTTRIANIKAGRVVVAMSPADAGKLQFAASVPPERLELMARWRLTPGFKANLVYDHPTWRANGAVGHWESADGRTSAVDTTPPEERPGVLSVLADRSALPVQRNRRQAAILAAVASGFPDLTEPRHYREQDWADAWNAGAWSALGVEILHRLGPWLRQPVDRIHWAGTETADLSLGLMDGAVRAGHRAAKEVLAAG